MNWDDLDWDNFSCVDMTRRIKDEIDKEITNISVVEYLRRKSVDKNTHRTSQPQA
ncbi:MAG: hypothetical protein LBH25_11580 [Fibromonadaceae bacterium]|jgi:hypothetical protein|nr:hypothetical protein [Fibromonadaceae bacterium]